MFCIQIVNRRTAVTESYLRWCQNLYNKMNKISYPNVAHTCQKYHKNARKNALLNFSFSVSCELRRMQFLLSNLYFSLYSGNCRFKEYSYPVYALPATFVPLPVSYSIIVPLKKIKTKKQDSVGLGMRFRIQTTGKCESWAATCETVPFK